MILNIILMLKNISGKIIYNTDKYQMKLITATDLIKSYQQQVLRIPYFQRDINENSIDQLQKEILSNRQWLFQQGNLTICYIEISKHDVVYYITDGQHRLVSLNKLYDEHIKVDDIILPIIFIKVNNMKEMEKIYIDKNKNTPMSFQYMYYSDDFIKKHLNTIKEYLIETYGKKSFNTKYVLDDDHLSIDEFMKNFPESELKNYLNDNDQDIQSLLLQIDYANECARELLKEDDIKKTDYNRCENTGFYLPYKQINCIDVLYDRGDIIINPIKKYKKIKISKTIRDKLWRIYFNGLDGICDVCEKLITNNTFHAGHIIAESKGGSNNLDNLKPLCPSCNYECGTENLDDFKAKYKYQKNIEDELKRNLLHVRQIKQKIDQDILDQFFT